MDITIAKESERNVRRIINMRAEALKQLEGGLGFMLGTALPRQ